MSEGTVIILGMIAMVCSAPIGIVLGYKLVKSKIWLTAVAALGVAGLSVTVWCFYVRMADYPNKLWIMPAAATVMLLAYSMSYGYGFRTSDEKRAAERRKSLEASADQWERQLATDAAAKMSQLVLAYDRCQIAHYYKALGRPNAALSLFEKVSSVYQSELGTHPLARTFYAEYAALLREELRVEEAEKIERLMQGA
jgi:tetratricopeptide (TPR) repeat protein